MRYLKSRDTLLNENLETDLFELVYECIIGTYTDLNEFYNVVKSFSNKKQTTKDLFSNLVYNCIPIEYKKDIGRVFVNKYIFGNKKIELIKYLSEKFKNVNEPITNWIFTNMNSLTN